MAVWVRGGAPAAVPVWAQASAVLAWALELALASAPVWAQAWALAWARGVALEG